MEQKSHTPHGIKRVAVLCGGWSGEREVSLVSGRCMRDALVETGKYEAVTLIDVRKDPLQLIRDVQAAHPEVLVNGLHGIGGEDGILQGFLEMMDLPYTHSGVAASALSMDKVRSREVFIHQGIGVPEYRLLPTDSLREGIRPFAFPWVIKPRNEGSSLGVWLIRDESALKHFFEEEDRAEVLVERFVEGKEVQAAVLEGRALGAIEILTFNSAFFDYHSKYTSGEAEHIMPAPLSKETYARVLEDSEKAYAALGCHGVARLDFIVSKTEEVVLLELNSQPGMTPTSLVPEIAQYAGLSYVDLIEGLINDAVIQFQKDKKERNSSRKEAAAAGVDLPEDVSPTGSIA